MFISPHVAFLAKSLDTPAVERSFANMKMWKVPVALPLYTR